MLLDENLIRVSCESPLYIGQADKELLNEAVLRDTVFLASHEMMDYSLLAGICTRENELVVGIIDYIRSVVNHDPSQSVTICSIRHDPSRSVKICQDHYNLS